MAAALYDSIGQGYSARRQPDPRLARLIHEALGDSRSVINVGAGAGSYEPTGRVVTAVEPSAAMIAQRPAGSAPAVQASAECLPFADASFDAAMAVLTVHHWQDQTAGLAELRRVARNRVVIVTFDPAHPRNWLEDYLPGLRRLDEAKMPPMDSYAEALGPVEISPLPVPHDCRDGFLHAFWRRPHAYCDPAVRAAMSSFSLLDECEAGLERLAQDLASGAWHARYGHLLDLAEWDAGYRLVLARLPAR